MNDMLYRSFYRAGEFLERHSRLAAAALLFMIFLASFGQAAGKPFDNDEVYTWIAAAQHGWSGVWNFYATGADTPSPLPALLVHATLHFRSNPEITTRIPFILAFLVMCLCLYAFMRRRYPAGYALAALIAPVVLPFFFHYATVNRAYPLLLAGAGFAMVCWQTAQQTGKSRIWGAAGLWFGLAFAISAHTFAIFLFIPFAVAQFIADLEHKKINLPVWIALLLFPLGILPVLHGELVASHAYRTSFFSKPGWSMVQKTYKSFFAEPYEACGALILFAVFALLIHRHAAASNADSSKYSGFSRAEIVLASLLAFTPVYVLPLAKVLGVYREPYSCVAIFGFVFCIVAALAELSNRKAALGAAMLVAMLAAAGAKTASFFHWRILAHPQRVHAEFVRQVNHEDWMQMIAASPLPVAISDMNAYTKAHFYAPASLQQRLWYPTDLSLAAQYPKSVSVQLNVIRAGKFAPLPSMDWAEFSARYPHFLLANGSLEEAWLPFYLASQPRDQVKIQFLGPSFDSPVLLYDVQILNPSELQAPKEPQ